jgi:hypothetical protein
VRKTNVLLIVQNFTLKLVIHANPASHLAIHVSTKITPARVAMDVMDSHFFMDLNASQNARLVPMLTENSKFVKVVWKAVTSASKKTNHSAHNVKQASFFLMIPYWGGLVCLLVLQDT